MLCYSSLEMNTEHFQCIHILGMRKPQELLKVPVMVRSCCWPIEELVDFGEKESYQKIGL
jgi:hypothetical protein